MKQIFIVAIFPVLISCTSKSDSESSINQEDSIATSRASSSKVNTTGAQYDYESLFKLESYLVNAIDDSEPEIVGIDCAILIYPNEEQINEMKKLEGEENFYIGADDSNWYQGMAIEKMDSVGIKQISASGQYLRLKGQNKTWDLDIRKKNLPAWNLIFFKRTKEPKIISTVDLTVNQVKEYFEIAE